MRDGEQIFLVTEADPVVASEADALDLIGNAWVQGCDCITIPVEKLSDDFFELKIGLLGAITQKVANYGLKLVIVGDVAAHVAQSHAFRDYVHECGRGGPVRFVSRWDHIG